MNRNTGNLIPPKYSLIKPKFGPTGSNGPTGYTGPTGPTGFISIQGTNYSDYIYWNKDASDWAIWTTNVHIGTNAGQTGQEVNAVAVGWEAESNNQGEYSIAIGRSAGGNIQRSTAVAIGNLAGQNNQGTGSISIGNQSGYNNQEEYSIAIGYLAGYTGAVKNSLILNANENGLNPGASGFYVSPINKLSGIGDTGVLIYNSNTKQITYDIAKSFIIEHPDDNSKYLIHGCLEGPEDGVYYRGQGIITNNKFVVIYLPEYVKNLASNFSIQITPIEEFELDEKEEEEHIIKYYSVSKIKNNFFKVYGVNGSFFWHVYGQRFSIDVEPNKCDITIAGDGPYKYIVK